MPRSSPHRSSSKRHRGRRDSDEYYSSKKSKKKDRRRSRSRNRDDNYRSKYSEERHYSNKDRESDERKSYSSKHHKTSRKDESRSRRDKEYNSSSRKKPYSDSHRIHKHSKKHSMKDIELSDHKEKISKNGKAKPLSCLKTCDQYEKTLEEDQVQKSSVTMKQLEEAKQCETNKGPKDNFDTNAMPSTSKLPDIKDISEEDKKIMFSAAITLLQEAFEFDEIDEQTQSTSKFSDRADLLEAIKFNKISNAVKLLEDADGFSSDIIPDEVKEVLLLFSESAIKETKEDLYSRKIPINDKKTVISYNLNEEEPDVIKEDHQKPEVIKEDQRKPEVIKDQRKPEAIKEDQQKPEVIKEDQQNPEVVKEDEERPKIEFRCTNCDLNEFVHYYGTRPEFVNNIEFLEKCYIMKDPFSRPPPKHIGSKPEYFIVLGAHCSVCGLIVCKDSECSLFYEKTFCLNCATKNISKFPNEVRTKFKSQLSK